MYLDIKIGMVDHLSDLLQTVSVVISAEPGAARHLFFLSAIGNRGDHIFQGILVCTSWHPLLLDAWSHLMSMTQRELSCNYMCFCKELWRLLTVDLGVATLLHGLHRTNRHGCVFLLQENKVDQSIIRDAGVVDILMDGHVISMQVPGGPATAWFATRCWGWSHGFANDREKAREFAESLQCTTRLAASSDLEAGVVSVDEVFARCRGISHYSSLTFGEITQFCA